MTNSELLKKAIADSGLKYSAIMEALEIKSYSTLREKINNVKSFTVREIQILCVVLKLSTEKREQIFFTDETEFNSVSA